MLCVADAMWWLAVPGYPSFHRALHLLVARRHHLRQFHRCRQHCTYPRPHRCRGCALRHLYLKARVLRRICVRDVSQVKTLCLMLQKTPISDVQGSVWNYGQNFGGHASTGPTVHSGAAAGMFGSFGTDETYGPSLCTGTPGAVCAG